MWLFILVLFCQRAGSRFTNCTGCRASAPGRELHVWVRWQASVCCVCEQSCICVTHLFVEIEEAKGGSESNWTLVMPFKGEWEWARGRHRGRPGAGLILILSLPWIACPALPGLIPEHPWVFYPKKKRRKDSEGAPSQALAASLAAFGSCPAGSALGQQCWGPLAPPLLCFLRGSLIASGPNSDSFVCLVWGVWFLGPALPHGSVLCLSLTRGGTVGYIWVNHVRGRCPPHRTIFPKLYFLVLSKPAFQPLGCLPSPWSSRYKWKHELFMAE